MTLDNILEQINKAEKIVILPPFGDGNIVYYILGAVVSSIKKLW